MKGLARNQTSSWASACLALGLSIGHAACGGSSGSNPPLSVSVESTSPVVPATSATSASVQASTHLEVSAVTVGVMPISALLPLDISQKFTATVANDTANKGVTWALTQNGAPCSPACGSINPSSTASGSPATYSAPAALPANRTVVLTAASVTEANVSVKANVTLTKGSVSLVPVDMTFEGCKIQRCPVPPQVAVLTNTGRSALSITGITIGGTYASFFAESNTCGKTVAAGASCNFRVTYTSPGPGTRTAVLSIADNSPATPQQLFLTGINKSSDAAALHAALRDQSVAAVPRPTGDSQVGTRLMHWVDDSRVDPYRADGTKRELMVRFWYPTSGNTACTLADYTSAGVLSQFSQLLDTTLPQISTNSCLNAPIATGTHPVVVVTPGFTGTFTDYTFLTEDLASRGYLVVAVDHTYEATAVEFPDGRVEQGIFGSYLTRYTRSDPQALAFAVSVRLADLRFVVNKLSAVNGGGDQVLADKLDLSRIALLGHSLGGLTTLLGVEKDARFRAGISLDGLVPDRLTPPTATPILLVRAGINPWNENDCQLWSALRGNRVAVSLPGAEHIALSDAVWLGSGAVATGHMGIEETIAAIRETSAAFLNAAFTGASMDGPAFRSLLNDPDAVITIHGQSPCSEP
jgi:predicted dienelactone hydrolase